MNDKTGFLPFLIGGLVGAAVALLYAPRSGEETRQMLMDNSQEIMDKAVKSIQEVQDAAIESLEETQARMEALNQEAKERFMKLQGIGQATLEEQQQILEKGFDKAKETVITKS